MSHPHNSHQQPQPPLYHSHSASYPPPGPNAYMPTMNQPQPPQPPQPPHLPIPTQPGLPLHLHHLQPSPQPGPHTYSSYPSYPPSPYSPHVPTPYPPPYQPTYHHTHPLESPTTSGPFLPPGALNAPPHSPGLPNGQAPNPYESAAHPQPPTSQGPLFPPPQHSASSFMHHPPPLSYMAPPPIYGNTTIPTPHRLLHTSEVKLEISCKGLRDRDITSKSDPTCVVFLENPARSTSVTANTHAHSYPFGAEPTEEGPHGRDIRWQEVGRTEYQKDNLNPHFKQQVPVEYRFESLQHIRLGLWDIDSKKPDLRYQQFLGDIETTLGELVSAGVWTAKLTSRNIRDTRKWTGGRRDLGTITVIVHETQDGGNLLIKSTMSGHKLDKKDLLWSDPYVIVHQVHSKTAESSSELYKSEVVKKNVNPNWLPCQFKAVIPKGGDKSDVILEFVVNDRDYRKRDDEIGIARATVAQLEQCSTLPVINVRRKKRRKHYKDSGTLEFHNFTAIRMPSLVDYLQGGLKLHFSVAVDLTQSNGPPLNPESLHYFADMHAGNHYIHALRAVGNVLAVYTPSDNQFAAFGFGAELPGRPGETSPCFPLGLGDNPGCYGIDGILHAYKTALSSVKLSGPTYFAPLIETVVLNSARRPNSQTDQNYDVLLILTDGALSDYDRTVDRIISASQKVPLSIIIVGIGNRDFKKMIDLDCDNDLLKSQDGTKRAARDICQFVAFNEYINAPPERLGAAVLAELPGNIVEYFCGSCNPPIMPGQRPQPPSINY